MKRRDLLKGAAVTGLGIATGKSALAQESTDGTPLQFAPKTPPDPDPLTDEFTKYPACPYCGMDRRQWHHSRHLIHYDDNRVDGTCSIHCAAISLSLNIDRGPRAIYAADYGAADEPRPLVNVEEGLYLIGSTLPGTMSARSKLAFASRDRAMETRKEHGGDLGDFDAALAAVYEDMARDVAMIRKRRAERRARQREQTI